jgi:hypothetical protein
MVTYQLKEVGKDPELTKEQAEKLVAAFMKDFNNGKMLTYIDYAIQEHHAAMKMHSREIGKLERLREAIRTIDPNNKAFQPEEL